ncbi:MAG: YceD family protein [Nocardioidaceae bacterium]
MRLEAVMEGVLASGDARVTIEGECARCLDPIADTLEVRLQELYVYPESDAEADEAARLDGELLDLEPSLRDAVVLALPFQPVCDRGCQGLCVECGARLSDDPQTQP